MQAVVKGRDEGYELKKGEVVYFKCQVVNILPNCIVELMGANIGEDYIKFICHVNSLSSETKFYDKGEIK